MSGIQDKIASLTPEQRRQFELLLAQERAPRPADAIARLPRSGGTQAFATSFAQRRLWFFDRLQPGNATYNVPIAARLRGALQPEALQRAFDAVAARHETLRTSLAVVNGEPR